MYRLLEPKVSGQNIYICNVKLLCLFFNVLFAQLQILMDFGVHINDLNEWIKGGEIKGKRGNSQPRRRGGKAGPAKPVTTTPNAHEAIRRALERKHENGSWSGSKGTLKHSPPAYEALREAPEQAALLGDAFKTILL